MSDELKDDPAFPVNDISLTQYPGMSLRDYFAAKAMQALVSNYRRTWVEQEPKDSEPTLSVLGGFEDDAISQASYTIADSMLKAREKQCQPKQ